MEARDLRIGNIVCFTDDADWSPVTVFGINRDAEIFVEIKFEDGTTDTVDVEEKSICSILLTEDWLLRMGFRKSAMYFDTDNLVICRFTDGLFHVQLQGKDSIIKSVHQLQNLFYAICGEELTIKND